MLETLRTLIQQWCLERDLTIILKQEQNRAQQKERARISKEIHDTSLQDMGITMHMLTRLREHLQQALGALEDWEAVSENSGQLAYKRAQLNTPINICKNRESGVKRCKEILEYLLGDGGIDVRSASKGAWQLRRANPDVRIASLPDTVPDATGERLMDDLLFQVRSSSQRLRDICTDLQPAVQDVPLVKTVVFSLQTLSQISPDVNLDLRVCGEEPNALSTSLKYLCKKIVEQAVYNALNHASASRIEVDIAFAKPTVAARSCKDHPSIAFSVTDDGTGFEPRNLHYWRSTHHRGLANMYDSAKMIGAILEINSAPNRGTKVTLVVPHNTNRSALAVSKDR